MGHLGGLFLFIAPLFCLPVCGAEGHSLSACHKQLEFGCSDGLCIPRPKACDGHSDCEDGSDESDCSHMWCQKDEFACHSGRCISVKLLCDGVDDCSDRSDEDSCPNCTAGLFSCGPSGACLPRNKLCDGRRDCSNGHDETRELCGSIQRPVPQRSPSSCAASEYQCGDGECIRHAWRCDRSPDCSDGSDEENCDIADQDECRVNNGGCSHYCLDQPIGFLCSCPDNMKLVDDSRCEEVDICLESDVCDQLCVHVNDSLTCKCLEGYHMNPTTAECRANGEAAQLVFTASKGVRIKSLISSDLKALAPHLPGSGPIAAMASNHTLYWAPKDQGSIYRISVDKKKQEAVLVLKVQGSVSGLVVDWIHHLLYWTSPEKGSLNVALLDGSSRRQLIAGLEKPSAVAVEPLRGFLFWAECGRTPVIERAGLDGRDRMRLVTSLIKQPVALSLDAPRQLLYWFDQGMRSISRVTLEGRHRKTVVESNGYLDRLFGLAVFEGFLYWGDEITNSICRANKHSGRNLHVLLSSVNSPGGVAIIHPSLQPNGPSACGRPGTMCQHKCAVDLQPERLRFSCRSPQTTLNKTETPVISRTVPASASSDATFAGMLALITFLSVLLVGMALWWWREEFRPPRSLTSQSFSLKESRDPLIVQVPLMDPDSSPIKETLLKLELDSD
ncbi:low-density lipoprotein receptor-related protein 8 [Kryptolebias marmoratus]|uniref:Low-density lipoprotein receptor-related protein 8-like n=1 Tax=Kryptolebias marmoratus TaxID=37003 RepID=A0A3Q3F506_KRYMA|nr:low-density lipoprotein receptor-related protein 8 [Kryptolebias marmoratus]